MINQVINKNLLKSTILLLSCYALFGIVTFTEDIEAAPWPIITGALFILIIIAYIFFVYWMMESAILLGKNKFLWMALSIIFHIFALLYIFVIVLHHNKDKNTLSVSRQDGVNTACQHCGTIIKIESNTCLSCGRPV